jgi:hypothetical protein
METDPRARLKQWLASGQARLHPLTFPQRELWENSPVPPGDPANHVCSFFEVKGPIIVDYCKAALRKVADRQDAMRTSFLPGKERPLQIVRSTGEAALHYRELLPSESSPEALEAVMEEGFRVPFDFVRGPLYRMHMLKRGPDDYVLAFAIHHAVADGWTLGAFIEDLCSAYIIVLQENGELPAGMRRLPDSLPPLPMTYAEWGAAERARWQPAELERQAVYWRKRLEGSRRIWNAKAQTGNFETLRRCVTEISGELADATRGLARQAGATLFSTLLAAFQLTLSRRTGIDDILVGTPVANRSKASARETMGYFAGIVPLRGFIDPKRPFSDVIKAVHTATMDDFAHAMPFAELALGLGATAAPGEHVLFDTRFAFQNHPIPDVVLPGISTKLRTCSTGTTRFDLGCEVTEDGKGFEVVWLYRSSVLSGGDILELDALFRDVLEAVCRDPGICSAAMTVSSVIPFDSR